MRPFFWCRIFLFLGTIQLAYVKSQKNKKKSENNVTINREMFLKQSKCVNSLISISIMNFYADINKDNSSNPRVLFFVHLCLWLQNEHEWQFCEKFAPHPGGTNDNDAHSCQPNYIKVQNKIIVKILPVNKFTTLKFLSLLRSMNG